MNNEKENNFNIIVGKQLRKIRIEKRMSLTDVANKMNTSRQMISCYELGKVPLKAYLFKDICKILGVTMDYVVQCAFEDDRNDKQI